MQYHSRSSEAYGPFEIINEWMDLSVSSGKERIQSFQREPNSRLVEM